jgi:hypothetical protein
MCELTNYLMSSCKNVHILVHLTPVAYHIFRLQKVAYGKDEVEHRWFALFWVKQNCSTFN